MDTIAATNLLGQLDDNIFDLETALEPVLEKALSETTKTLPLLDRAKLLTTIVYAIDSLLFSYLKINGVNVKEHKVWIELQRVKERFDKIKLAEAGHVQAQTQPQTPNLALDKQAAARIIQHALAANKNIDLQKAEAEARQRLLAKRKLKELETVMKEKAAAKDQSKSYVETTPTEQLVADLVAAAEEAAPMTAQTPMTTGTSIATEGEQNKSKKKDKKRKRASKDEDVEEGEIKLSKAERKKIRKEKKKEAKGVGAAVGAVVESPG